MCDEDMTVLQLIENVTRLRHELRSASVSGCHLQIFSLPSYITTLSTGNPLRAAVSELINFA